MRVSLVTGNGFCKQLTPVVSRVRLLSVTAECRACVCACGRSNEQAADTSEGKRPGSSEQVAGTLQARNTRHPREFRKGPGRQEHGRLQPGWHAQNDLFFRPRNDKPLALTQRTRPACSSARNIVHYCVRPTNSRILGGELDSWN